MFEPLQDSENQGIGPKILRASPKTVGDKDYILTGVA